MAQPLKDSFLDLERHRQLLEANVEKLRKLLQQWQIWSAEYEGLKEEILATPNATQEELLAIGKSYEGELVTQAEVEDILGVKLKSPRTSSQTINVLERRLDYVGQNVTTVEKQLNAAKEKLEKVAVLGQPEVHNEEGLPLMEIVEELDDDDNVINGRVEAPGRSRSVIEEVLKKAGVKELPERNEAHVEAAPDFKHERPAVENIPLSPAAPKLPVNVKKAVTFANDIKVVSLPQDTQEHPDEAKKAVSFADDTKTEPNHTKSRTAMRLEDVMNRAKEQAKPIRNPIIPIDESPEDAELRKQMLEYAMSDAMSEVGAVVAELDLEDDFSDEGYDDDDSSDLDDEDDFGRSTGTVVDESLRQRMRELEEKLGVRMMENVGKRADVDVDNMEEKVQNASPELIKESNLSVVKDTKGKIGGAKKAVRFAKDLDISPAPGVSAPADVLPQVSTILPKPSAPPLGDIVERAAPLDISAKTPFSEAAAAAAPKVSRFRASRSIASPPAMSPIFEPTRTRTVPTGPLDTTLSSKIVERDVHIGDATEPDGLDPALLQQEVATEYYKRRNMMVQKQGGFKGPEDEEERTGRIELTEEEGGRKKVSRFMAARLARD